MKKYPKQTPAIHPDDGGPPTWTRCSRRHFSKLTFTTLGALAIERVPGSVLYGESRSDESVLQPVQYGIGPCWPRDFGDIRALIAVPHAAGAVRVRIPWRRRDADPQAKAILLQDLASGKIIENVVSLEINREFGDIVFQPTSGSGQYALYYMPYTVFPKPARYSVSYLPPRQNSDKAWLARYRLDGASPTPGASVALPQAEVTTIQTRTQFDSFHPMETIATEEEKHDVLTKYRGRPCLLFPESREFSIRMTDNLPQRWMERGPGTTFHGQCRPNEFYVFQVGIYAIAAAMDNLLVEYENFISDHGAVIDRNAMRCFNLGGIGWDGQPFKKALSVEQGKVGALWFGIQIPSNAASGKYHGTITLRAAGLGYTQLSVILEISGPALPACGDDDLWRLSRLRWLDSTIAMDGGITSHYTPLSIGKEEIACLGRRLRLNRFGLPESIRSGEREILAAPLAFVIETDGGAVSWSSKALRIVNVSPDAVTWESRATAPEIDYRCAATMDFDGYVDFDVRLRAVRRLQVMDLRLEIPLLRDAAVYMMGLGKKGGYRPPTWDWKWDIGRANNSVWIGDFNAGLQLNLKGREEVWELFDLRASGIPDSWSNGGKGGCTVFADGDIVTVRAYSGTRTLGPDEEIQFKFGLLITPVKPLDPAHWKQRYYQQAYPQPGAVPCETLVAAGATVVNVHQGNELNPWINYPFLTIDKLSAYVDEVHSAGLKVKLYYTVRELSNHVLELWALRSLGYEVFTDGPGGGGAWLREHLVSHYKPAWHQTLPWGEVDEAITETGLSRWLNYYLEGLAYLLKSTQLDGLYLDGIGYNRQTMKRVRKVLDRTRPGGLIDLHSGNTFTFHDYRVSPANQYMGHFPYIDSLWFGEMYNYNEAPDYWLVEISGIPFGLFADMLQGGGNPWRGMIYGMTARCYQGVSPTPIWRLWDEFGIQEAEMIGYWDPSCPIRTSRPDILATVYKRSGKALIAVASWSPLTVTAVLSVDWSAFDIPRESAKLFAPEIEGFQKRAAFSISSEISFEPGKGWLLILEGATA